MTNFEYIKNNITELDLAYYEFYQFVGGKDQPNLFKDKIYDAWYKWAESASNNHGNMAKGNHNGRVIAEDPSVWVWENWHYPDGEWRKSGRNHIVSFLVWLSMQYDPDEWVEEN